MFSDVSNGCSASTWVNKLSVPKSSNPLLGSAMTVFGMIDAPTSNIDAIPANTLLGFHTVFLFFLTLSLVVSSFFGLAVPSLLANLPDLRSRGVKPPIPFTLGTGSFTGSVFFSLVGSSTSDTCSGGQ